MVFPCDAYCPMQDWVVSAVSRAVRMVMMRLPMRRRSCFLLSDIGVSRGPTADLPSWRGVAGAWGVVPSGWRLGSRSVTLAHEDSFQRVGACESFQRVGAIVFSQGGRHEGGGSVNGLDIVSLSYSPRELRFPSPQAPLLVRGVLCRGFS